jgi:hypothetical protein
MLSYIIILYCEVYNILRNILLSVMNNRLAAEGGRGPCRYRNQKTILEAE